MSITLTTVPELSSPADELSHSLAPVPGESPAARGSEVPAGHDVDGPAARGPEATTAQDEIEEPWLLDALADETGASTAEYAITVLAACGFAAVLVVLLKSGEVRGMLMSIITTALSLGQ
ncbi:hypothetical protein BF93_04385 [Brachybacterium phenoliresistens]|uniref:DUF4244 domain-containing protein n=1 Tax=Brachybacterium phenoliresistens TaxID=396014 RepID=Z9JPA2_9MICO|nr:DUF4244 domain-containing protein [Brachybacterium phenoliresistens]EWS80250.1 hypothetical protein BF93_04385 [Brachybacterium phenoliresistens]